MEEWRRGWPVVTGAALAAATGINLLYYVFSIFIPPLQKETGWTLGEFSQLQALVGLGSLTAPAVGWAMDRYGVRPVYAAGMALLSLFFIVIAVMPFIPTLFGVMVFVSGLIGVWTSSMSYTRAVAGWFHRNRGMALALAATGISLSAIVMPPVFERLIMAEGWRAGYVLLAALSGLIGLPAILFLLKGTPDARHTPADAQDTDPSMLRSPAFWLLLGSMACINFPGSGMLSQMVPMMLEEGISAGVAALGISAFAAGQVAGRLACGYLLDRANPQRVAFFFTLIPAVGCVLLWHITGSPGVAFLAVAAIGVQQGAEIDLFAFFVARRFGLARYGTVYGWIQVAAWSSTIAGVLGFGKVHDLTGSYALFQLAGAVAYAGGALLIAMVSLPPIRRA
jgi:MFS family permease